MAPVIQLAFIASWDDECSTTDSIGRVLDQRRDRLSHWNRLTMDLLRARCRGEIGIELDLLEQRYKAYPQSMSGRGGYAWALQQSNHPRAAREVLRQTGPRARPGMALFPRGRVAFVLVAHGRHLAHAGGGIVRSLTSPIAGTIPPGGSGKSSGTCPSRPRPRERA